MSTVFYQPFTEYNILGIILKNLEVILGIENFIHNFKIYQNFTLNNFSFFVKLMLERPLIWLSEYEKASKIHNQNLLPSKI